MKTPFVQRRILLPLVLGLAVLGVVSRCVPEKEVDLGKKATPLTWLDEETYLYSQDGIIHAANIGEGVTRSGNEQVPEWVEDIPKLNLEPKDPAAIFREDGHTYMMVAGEKTRVESNTRWDRAGINQGLSRMKGIPYITYLHLGNIGLVVFEKMAPKLINLPLRYPENRSAPFVVWDKHAGMFFALQTGCQYPAEPGSCLRTGWWLDRDLSVVQTLALPEEDLLSVAEKASCFSCGCGCYTQEDVYAVAGKVFFQISGFPIPPSRRGLYELEAENDGTTKWRQVIKGRIEPPLAFSPSGCRVSFYQVSYWGDGLAEEELCP